MAAGIIFNNQEFKPGDSGLVRITIGNLPSGNRISIFVHIFCGLEEGPTMLLLGGMHGDEINGVEIIRRSISQGMFADLKRGNIIAIPLLNIFGFINFERDVAEGKDVNRSFPGSSTGSLASRVARFLTKKILPIVDFGIDFHTGGTDRWNIPQIRYAAADKKAKELAIQTECNVLIEKAVIAKSLRKAAREIGTPILVFEGGEASRIDPWIIEKGQTIIRNILHKQQFFDPKKFNPNVVYIYKKQIWIRAPQSGLLIWSLKSGRFIKKGELVAIIADPFAQKETRVESPRDGYVICHNNAPVVTQGDGIFHIAFMEEKYLASHV